MYIYICIYIYMYIYIYYIYSHIIYIHIAQLWHVYCLLTARMELLSQWHQASLGAESQFFSLSGLAICFCWDFPWASLAPSGKHTKNYGKSPCFMGKSTISMAIFNSFLYVYQRVIPLLYFNWANPKKSWDSWAGRRRHGKHVALPWTSSNRRRWRAGLCWWLEPLAPAKRSGS